MGLFKKKEITKEDFKCLTPLGRIRKGDSVTLELFDDHIEFTNRIIQKQPIILKYSKITNVDYASEWEKYEKDRSPIGRAIVGHFLFGDTGAQVGAISGIQKKEVKKFHLCLAISYISKDNTEEVLLFEDYGLSHIRTIFLKLREKCNLDEKENITEL